MKKCSCFAPDKEKDCECETATEAVSVCTTLLGAEPTQKQLFDACMAFRHDYGLMGPVESENLRWQARLWLQSWKKAGL